MEWLQKILANAVYGEDGKLDVDATMKKSTRRHQGILSRKSSTTQK